MFGRVSPMAVIAAFVIVGGACLWAWSPWSDSAPQEWTDVNESMAALLADQQETREPLQEQAAKQLIPKEQTEQKQATEEPTPEEQAPEEKTLEEQLSKEQQQQQEFSVIDINLATASELDTLPGIGAKKAAAIIAYREENGPFRKIEDIMNVKGIGEKMFANMKERLSVGK